MADQDAGAESGAEPSESESEWRFPLSEFEDEGAADGTASPGSDRSDGTTGEADVDGGLGGTARERIEAGDPTLEGTFFLLLGVAFALFVISRLVVG